MNGTMKMMRLDLITIKPYMKTYLVMLGIFVFLCFMDVGATELSVISSVYMIMISGSIFSVEERNNLERLYGALSVNRRSIIRGRYLYLFLHYLLAIACSLLAGLVVSAIKKTPLNPIEFLIGAAIAFLIFCFITGIQTPVYFHLGYTKARFIAIIPFVLMMALVASVSYFINKDQQAALLADLDRMLTGRPHVLMLACALMGILMLWISYRVSLRSYRMSK